MFGGGPMTMRVKTVAIWLWFLLDHSRWPGIRTWLAACKQDRFFVFRPTIHHDHYYFLSW